MRKRILVVGMLDSIHLARWLSQFKNRELEIHLFPSNHFKKIHPQIRELVLGKSECVYTVSGGIRISGLIDFVMEKLSTKLVRHFARTERLFRCLKEFKPLIVHAVELQHAGYLCLNLIDLHGKDFELISTNWGSDIVYFENYESHRARISRLLQFSDYYSAECMRDVLLAKKFDFSGKVLPVVPNAGGFAEFELSKNKTRASSRSMVLIKSYGGEFGRSELVLQCIPELIANNSNVTFFLYSVTEDLLPSVVKLTKANPSRIQYSTVAKPLSRDDLMWKFESARVYVGCSISDGISTSFLEALVFGAYPIQTNTSCGEEWLSKGARASLVPLDSKRILHEIQWALSQDVIVDEAQEANLNVAKKWLNEKKISEEVQIYY